MRPRYVLILIALLLSMTVSVVAQNQPESTPEPEATAAPEATAEPEATVEPEVTPAANDVQLLVPQVLNTYPHDPTAFTQGLLLSDGVFYESTGRYGQSTLRKVDPETGEVQQSISIDDTYFAEGLARVDDRLIQLTWKAGKAFVYDVNTFDLLNTFDYQGEGWGLCYDGDYLYMSDGSPTIFIRDPETFNVVGSFTVTLTGSGVPDLNELECVGDDIWANVWQTDFIVRFDKVDGIISAVVYAPNLLNAQQAVGADVLNGIAYNPDHDTFYITGKLWPVLYEVHFVEYQGNR